MKQQGAALRLTTFIGEVAQWHHKPLHAEIVHRARVAGLAGTTVLRGLEGCGAPKNIHTTRTLSLAEDLPLVIRYVGREHEDDVR